MSDDPRPCPHCAERIPASWFSTGFCPKCGSSLAPAAIAAAQTTTDE